MSFSDNCNCLIRILRQQSFTPHRLAILIASTEGEVEDCLTFINGFWEVECYEGRYHIDRPRYSGPSSELS